MAITVPVNECYSKDVKKPEVAGVFYPHSAIELKDLIKNSFGKFGQKNTYNDSPKVFLFPHSSYEYIADLISRSLCEVKQDFDTVIILTTSHRKDSEGVALFNGIYKTPLGDVKVEEEKQQRISHQMKKAEYYPEIHKEEYGIEILLPFFQVYKSVAFEEHRDFRLVPVILGQNFSEKSLKRLSMVIASLWDKETLIVGCANIFSKDIVEKICENQYETIYDFLINSEDICGSTTVLLTVYIGRLLGYEKLKFHFSPITDTKSGYSSIIFN